MSDKTNCPNCGAPIDSSKSKCPYCDTPYQKENDFSNTHPDLYSHFDEKLNGFTITAEPGGAPIFLEFLTPNEHRALYGLPPIPRARQNNKEETQ